MPVVFCRGGQRCLGSFARWTEGPARHRSHHRAGASDAMFSGRAELRPSRCQLQAFRWSRPRSSDAGHEDGSALAMKRPSALAFKRTKRRRLPLPRSRTQSQLHGMLSLVVSFSQNPNDMRKLVLP